MEKEARIKVHRREKLTIDGGNVVGERRRHTADVHERRGTTYYTTELLLLFDVGRSSPATLDQEDDDDDDDHQEQDPLSLSVARCDEQPFRGVAEELRRCRVSILG